MGEDEGVDKGEDINDTSKNTSAAAIAFPMSCVETI